MGLQDQMQQLEEMPEEEAAGQEARGLAATVAAAGQKEEAKQLEGASKAVSSPQEDNKARVLEKRLSKLPQVSNWYMMVACGMGSCSRRGLKISCRGTYNSTVQFGTQNLADCRLA